MDSSGSSDGGSAGGSSDGLRVLIGASGDAELKAVQDAVAAWAKESGKSAEVIPASGLSQQLSQGFASGSPSDVFYLSADAVAGYASNGSLEPYGDTLSTIGDFYPGLVEAFTVDGKQYGAPKDFSTLALVINSDLWAAAGLTDADIPASWDQLAAAAQKLTQGSVVGLATSGEYQRLGAFMAQAGGELVTDGKATANSTQNVEALNYVKSLLAAGHMKFAKDLGAGWGGEAIGKGLCAMTIEGNWIVGGLKADYPDVKYTVVELPAGPAGKGTLQFTNAWGIAADSSHKEDAVALVEFLTSADQQMAFAGAFGVMPSLSTVAGDWQAANPELAAFSASAEYAKNVPGQEGVSDVVSDLNSQLESLASADPKAILDSVQSNLESVLA